MRYGTIHRSLRSLLVLLGLSYVLGFRGCATLYSVVEFEVLEPATVSFPDEVGQLLILNRAPITFDVIDEEERQGMKPEQLVMLDTSITHSLFRGLLDMLRLSPIERFHTPFWLTDRRTDTVSMEDMQLTRREVEDLCNHYGADAIISLEYYSLDVDNFEQYYTDDLGYLQTYYYLFSNRIHWNIYLPGNPRPFDSYNMRDTLYFTRVLDGEIYPVPSGMEMVRELFLNSGLRYGRYLVPLWTHTSRYLYKGKGDPLKFASRYTDRGEWDTAYTIWRELAGTGADSTMVAKAFHNMAIFHELEDDLDSASFFLDRALEYDSLEYAVLYREELDTRILNKEEVIRQVR